MPIDCGIDDGQEKAGERQRVDQRCTRCRSGLYGQFYDEYSLFKRAAGILRLVEPALAATHKADYVDRVCFPFEGCLREPARARFAGPGGE